MKMVARKEYIGDDKIVRYCAMCGKKMVDGMTDLMDFYVHEECFPAAMDKEYGPGNWIGYDEPNSEDGYYSVQIDGKWEETGIFYTDWYDEDDDYVV